MSPTFDQGVIEALHEAAESYIIGLLGNANLLDIHARRVTLQPHGIQLTRRIHDDKDWNYLVILIDGGKSFFVFNVYFLYVYVFSRGGLSTVAVQYSL